MSLAKQSQNASALEASPVGEQVNGIVSCPPAHQAQANGEAKRVANEKVNGAAELAAVNPTSQHAPAVTPLATAAAVPALDLGMRERDRAAQCLLDAVVQVQSDAELDIVRRAHAFAVAAHADQWRRSGDPYVVHPERVAKVIAEMRLDVASVCAALLHDVVEDTPVALDEIRTLFGEEIAFLVDGVTKLGRINFNSKEDQQAESFRKLVIAMAKDIRVLLVKLADRLDNMRTLEHMKRASQERIALETRDIYAPLAARLGMNWLKAELEDLSFKYLSPESYAALFERVQHAAADQERIIGDVSDHLKRMMAERQIDALVSGRIKHLYSIHNKMQRTGCDFDYIHDFVAFRVITESVEDCYAALGVVHSSWTPIPGRFKDYVALPKPNRYQSLHTTVIGPERRRIEVQIRTQAMHRTAEHGIAAHWQYKGVGGGIDGEEAARFSWLRQLAEFQREVADPAEFIDTVRVDLFPDEVYVFTPMGEVKTLPRGSTPIDFAYTVHSEVGNHCAGARVNDVMVPLRQPLHNGDVVEIITHAQQKPGKDWLSYAGTGRARSKIRAFLRQEERERSIQLGRDVLAKRMRKEGLSLTRFARSAESGKVLASLRVKNIDELSANIGYGRISVQELIDALEAQKKTRNQCKTGLIEKAVERVERVTQKKTQKEGIIIQGFDDIWVRLAQCCNPVRGEQVTGWITHGRGVTVHRRSCPSAMALDPARRIEVSWAEDWGRPCPVALRVITDDRPGILACISAIMTRYQLNIIKAACRSEGCNRAVNRFDFEISSFEKLQGVIRRIAALPGVMDVERCADEAAEDS